jgi:hypothetical protein
MSPEDNAMHHKRDFGGNGSGKGLAHRTPLRLGWVIYHAGDPAPPESEGPLLLNEMLQKDLLENPSIEPRLILPLVREGNTIAIHLWYTDQAAGD